MEASGMRAGAACRLSCTLAVLALVTLLGNAGCGDTDSSQVAPSIAFVRATGGPPHYDLATARADGRDIRLLSGGSRKGTVVPTLFGPPAWSPDGRLLAFGGVRRARDAGSHGDIYVIPASGGA